MSEISLPVDLRIFKLYLEHMLEGQLGRCNYKQNYYHRAEFQYKYV